MAFKGKHALITGGTRGIGRAAARLLAREGCHLALNYMRNQKAADETRREIEALGVECITLPANLYKLKNVRDLFAALKKQWGHLDYFVSNAALGDLRPAMQITETGWNLTMDVNAKAFLFGVQEAVKLMEGRKGKIVATSSVGSIFSLPGYGVIGASKAAIETLARYLAQELAPKNIWVNVASGGPVETESLKAFPNYAEVARFTLEKTPFKRMGTPEDIAKVILWLLSDDSDWVTGQTIVADGGLTLG